MDQDEKNRWDMCYKMLSFMVKHMHPDKELNLPEFAREGEIIMKEAMDFLKEYTPSYLRPIRKSIKPELKKNN